MCGKMPCILRPLIVLAALTPSPLFAGYDANLQGAVTMVVTYTGVGKPIFFRLANQPSSHPSCLTDYFAIDGATDLQQLNRAYARLLAAYVLGETVNVGYDSQGDCADDCIRVREIG